MGQSPAKVRHFWADAWLLIATGLASRTGRATLAAVIGGADAIQHAIPAFDEVDGGLARLSAAGLLRRDGDAFCLTAQGLGLVDLLGPGSWLRKQDAVAEVLGAVPWSSSYRPGDAARGQLPPVVTEAEFTTALQGYART
jgi:hypothetical protein